MLSDIQGSREGVAVEEKLKFILILLWEFVRVVPVMIITLVKEAKSNNLNKGGSSYEDGVDKRN